MILNKVITKYNILRRSFIESFRTFRQKIYLLTRINTKTKKLIIFFIEGPWRPGESIPASGGLLSIDSIYKISKTLFDVHRSEVILCTLTGKNLYSFPNFTSSSRIVSLPLLKKFKNPENVIIHVPEYLTAALLSLLSDGTLRTYLQPSHLHINLLNQNIQLMPPPSVVSDLKEFADTITQTTAHKKYCSEVILGKYNIPYYLLGVWIDIKQYNKTSFENKKDLILFSPDGLALNEEVRLVLEQEFPQYEFRTIQKLSYKAYKALITKAKYCFTFGEGLDAYFIESFFSNTLCFAIYNEDFFTSVYSALPTVLPNVTKLKESVVQLIRQTHDREIYYEFIRKTKEILTKDYSFTNYTENIKKFYETFSFNIEN